MAKMKSKKVLKNGNGDVAAFIYVGKLLKRNAPENLNVFFPGLNLGFGKWISPMRFLPNKII